VRVFVIFKKHTLFQLVRWLFQFFGNAHDHKATRLLPSSGLVNAAVILDGFAFIGSIPCGRGRNAGYPAPPAQIPACAANALGSCLG